MNKLKLGIQRLLVHILWLGCSLLWLQHDAISGNDSHRRIPERVQQPIRNEKANAEKTAHYLDQCVLTIFCGCATSRMVENQLRAN